MATLICQYKQHTSDKVLNYVYFITVRDKCLPSVAAAASLKFYLLCNLCGKSITNTFLHHYSLFGF